MREIVSTHTEEEERTPKCVKPALLSTVLAFGIDELQNPTVFLKGGYNLQQ